MHKYGIQICYILWKIAIKQLKGIEITMKKRKTIILINKDLKNHTDYNFYKYKQMQKLIEFSKETKFCAH